MRLCNLTEGRPRLYLIDDGAVLRTVMEVHGGTITTFNREGVDYTQVLWRQSGGFVLSDDASSYLALGAGGASTASGFNKGGGGAGEVKSFADMVLTEGNYTVSIGAGGAAGSAGSPSQLAVGGSPVIACFGGGLGGAGTSSGGDGGNGGGAGGNTGGVWAGGVGIQNNGGNSGGTDRTPGGGGGAGGVGGNGVDPLIAGNGGVGITLAWTDPVLNVGGGGGGGGNVGSTGTASHGGTAGTDNTQPRNADWSGGAGGSRVSSVVPSLGGNGFCVIVVRSDEVIVS